MSKFSLSCPSQDVATRLIAEVFLKPLEPNLTIEDKPELHFQLSDSTRTAKDLTSLLKIISQQTNVLGTTEAEKKDGVSWLEKLTLWRDSSNIHLNALNEHLLTRTFMIGHHLTAVDLLVYAFLHAYMTRVTHEDFLKYPCVTRHFDFIQHFSSVRAATQNNTSIEFPLVNINLDDVPEVRRTSVTADKKEKKFKPTSAVPEQHPLKQTDKATPQSQKPEDADTPKTGARQEKKDKKKSSAPGDSKKPTTVADSPPMPHMIDMRVGKIIHVEKHPGADSLYVEKIDFGEAEPRTVVSGLVNYIPIEEMRDRLLVGICNLKPANMRGVKSFAMVLAATSKDGKGGAGSVELIAPPPGSQPGDRVFFEGFEGNNPVEQLNPKKKQFETIQPNLTTLSSREACWKDPNNDGKPHRIITERGVCTSPTFVGASLS